MPLSQPGSPDDSSLVSVIIIFFNAKRFIGEAIDSVFAQTYSDWELLLVDDGSTDGSTDLARQRQQAAPRRVRYFNHESHANLGQSVSRNKGIAHARGEFLALLDADDVWMPHKLEQQIAILRACPRASLVCGRSQYWTGSATPDQQDSLLPAVGDPNQLMEPPELLRRWLAGSRTIPLPSDIAFRRSMTSRIGGFPEPFPRLYEDLAFMIKVFLREPVFVADACWDRIRRHPDSCVARAAPDDWNRAWLFFLSWLERYLRESGLQESEFWQPVQNELWPFRHPVLFRLQKLRRRAARLISR